MIKIEKKRFGDIVNFKRGYDIPSHKRDTGIYPIISSGGISGWHSKFKVSGEGLITGRYGTLGEVYYINRKYWPHNTTLYVTDFKGNYPKYVYFLMKCLGNLKTSDKSSVPGINRNDLHEICVPYIAQNFQKDIADFLFSIEYKIELNNRINAQLEAMAKTLYDYWFVQFDFPDANGKPYKTSGGKMVYNETLKREIPEGWKTGSLINLGEIIGGSTPPKNVDEYFTSNGTPWITPKDLSMNAGNKFITKGELDVTDKGIRVASLNIMPKGTILLSSRAPIGYLAISREKVTTNQGFKSFVPNKGFPVEFVYYSISNLIPTIENNASGSTFKEISASTLKIIPACLPTKILAKKYSDLVNGVFMRQDLLEIENQKLTELRDWLLPMLMNGQVTVGNAYQQTQETTSIAAEPVTEYGTKPVLNIPENRKGFAKQVLAGKIVSLFKNDPNFTRIKFQKLQFLAEHIAEAELNLNYYFQAAGPYDNRFMHTIIDSFKKSKWFLEKDYKFIPLENQTKIEGYYQGYFSPVESKLNNLFTLLENTTEAQAEIIATLYAVWNNRIISQQPIEQEALINDFYSWSERKHQYTNQQVVDGLEWLKSNNFVPTGFGKLIKTAKSKK